MNINKGVIQLSLVNIIIFIICSTNFAQNIDFYEIFAIYPFNSEDFFLHQFITYQFLHSSFEHLFYNLLFLFSFGNIVETKYGTKNLWNFYLLFGIGAAVLEILCNPHTPPIVGSSGSIFGIMVMSGLILPLRKIEFLFPIYVSIIIISLLITELINSFCITQTDGVAHFAHIGGSITALLVFFALKFKNKLSS